MGRYSKLNNVELHNLYFSSNILGYKIKEGEICWICGSNARDEE
jgi:hypothetical protein